MKEDKTRYQQIQEMSDEELKELANQKNRKGIATTDANTAQKVLADRAGQPFKGKYVGRPFGSKHFWSADNETGWK